MLKRLFLFFILIAPLNSFADATTGNELYSWLGEYKKVMKNDRGLNPFEAGQAMGFIEGISLSLNDVPQADLNNAKFCIPDKATKGQIVDVVFVYLEANPKWRHISAHYLVRGALIESYLCE